MPESPSSLPVRPPDRKLESWKEIAAYFSKGVTTVRRWETLEGLPVHRVQHVKGPSVYAYESELKAWLDGRNEAPAPRHRRYVIAAAAVAGVLALTAFSRAIIFEKK